jgi:DNA polymerase (family X)
MPAINESIAGRLEEVASLLAQQGANRFRGQAYQHAASALRKLDRPVSEIFAEEGLEGLEEIPGVGISIARSIRDILRHGKLAMLERMRGETDPVALLRSVPGIGKTLAWRLYGELGVASLEELELAAHDGRLQAKLGLGAKRLAGIRDSLAHRLGRVQASVEPASREEEVGVAELLDVDAEYLQGAAAGSLKKIAPRRFNPKGEAWLPVLHTTRGARHYTALFSNTARAHELHKDRDWVMLYWDGDQRERQCTVVTAQFGRLQGLRVVRGRETECEEHYRTKDKSPETGQLRLFRTAA